MHDVPRSSRQSIRLVQAAAPVDEMDHQSLALWAADCAERVLPLFETEYPDDRRPREAIDAARAWARGEIQTDNARAAALAAHAAARTVKDPCARAAARAAGHAAATAHVPTHAHGTASYAATAEAIAAGVKPPTSRARRGKKAKGSSTRRRR